MKHQALVAIAVVGCLALASSAALHGAGSNPAEEAAIRKLATANTNVPGMTDQIFWSGAYKRPTVGNERGEPREGPGAVGERVPGSQKSKTEILRIVVADSADLAYEYSKAVLEFDLKSGQHVMLETGILRVWQKQGKDWKVAAQFIRPYEN